MSYVDIGKMTMLRRMDMQQRIQNFNGHCDAAIQNILKLKAEVADYINSLNCDPLELKANFLKHMNQIDLYDYIVSGFNMDLTAQFPDDDYLSSLPLLPENQNLSMVSPSDNLFDTICQPSTSQGIKLKEQQSTPKSHTKKPNQNLIDLSDSSMNSDLPLKCNLDRTEVELNNLDLVKGTPMSQVQIPRQELLQVDHTYPAFLMHVENLDVFMVTESLDDFEDLRTSMFDHYSGKNVFLKPSDLRENMLCTFYENTTKNWYRCLILECKDKEVHVYLIDTGETMPVLNCIIEPLQKEFCEKPPFVNRCQLADIKMVNTSEACQEKVTEFIKQYHAAFCEIFIEDNSSETAEIYVTLPDGQLLNVLLVEEKLVVPIEGSRLKELISIPKNPPPAGLDDSSDDPEYEDAIVAVSGYHNRDEEEICQFYKGGAEKTCFKGNRCKKKHILRHPDGWTMDRTPVAVATGFQPTPLPVPGTLVLGRVSCVSHVDSVYIQLQNNDIPKDDVDRREFCSALPPTNLDDLIDDMNKPSTVAHYKKYSIFPALGEMVAALYPPDNKWYRARILSIVSADNTLEVRYVDYGTVCHINEKLIRQLDFCFLGLPSQAIACKLAGLELLTDNPLSWVEAKQYLTDIVQDQEFDVHVVSRAYDEMTVGLFSEEVNICKSYAEANPNIIKYVHYKVQDDRNCTYKVLVP